MGFLHSDQKPLNHRGTHVGPGVAPAKVEEGEQEEEHQWYGVFTEGAACK